MRFLTYFIVLGFVTVTTTAYCHAMGFVVVPHPEVLAMLGFSFGMGCFFAALAENI